MNGNESNPDQVVKTESYMRRWYESTPAGKSGFPSYEGWKAFVCYASGGKLVVAPGPTETVPQSEEGKNI
jgi:hypothetical protein